MLYVQGTMENGFLGTNLRHVVTLGNAMPAQAVIAGAIPNLCSPKASRDCLRLC